MADPQVTGYRAVHLITERADRQIEIQIRTPSQQSWAMSVETIAGETGWQLKDGVGPVDALAYYRAIGEVLAISEAGYEVPDDLLNESDRLRQVTIGLINNRQPTT